MTNSERKSATALFQEKQGLYFLKHFIDFFISMLKQCKVIDVKLKDEMHIF